MDQMFSRHPKAMAGGELMAAMRSVGQNDRLRKALESEIDLGELTPDDFATMALEASDRLTALAVQTSGVRELTPELESAGRTRINLDEVVE